LAATARPLEYKSKIFWLLPSDFCLLSPHMSKQYNKGIKRQRRKAYLKRRKQASKTKKKK